MRAIGFPELLGIVASLLLVVVPVWIASKAKPLGPMPYRWGKYIGINSTIVGIGALLAAVPALLDGVHWQATSLMLIGSCVLMAGVGVLRRLRWGVILLVLGYLALALGSTGIGPQSPLQSGRTGPFLLLTLLNVLYFRKRWRLMGTGL